MSIPSMRSRVLELQDGTRYLKAAAIEKVAAALSGLIARTQSRVSSAKDSFLASDEVVAALNGSIGD